MGAQVTLTTTRSVHGRVVVIGGSAKSTAKWTGGRVVGGSARFGPRLTCAETLRRGRRVVARFESDDSRQDD